MQLEQEEKDRQEVIDREKLAVIEDFPIEFQLASNCGLRSVQSSGLVIDKVNIDGPFEKGIDREIVGQTFFCNQEIPGPNRTANI